VLHSAI
jgi:hypothetical protein